MRQTLPQPRSQTAMVLLFVAAMFRSDKPVSVRDDLTFLTRGGCVNTAYMVENLDDALEALGWPSDYQYVDLDTLRDTDPRTGYPTPSVLYRGRDLFGLPTPRRPYGVPS